MRSGGGDVRRLDEGKKEGRKNPLVIHGNRKINRAPECGGVAIEWQGKAWMAWRGKANQGEA